MIDISVLEIKIVNWILQNKMAKPLVFNITTIL